MDLNLNPNTVNSRVHYHTSPIIISVLSILLYLSLPHSLAPQNILKANHTHSISLVNTTVRITIKQEIFLLLFYHFLISHFWYMSLETKEAYISSQLAVLRSTFSDPLSLESVLSFFWVRFFIQG